MAEDEGPGRSVGRGPGEPDAPDAPDERLEAEAAEGSATDEDTRIADAAASALARARSSAADKGLRPGMRPRRKRRFVGDGAQLSGSARDGRDPTLLGDQMDRLLVDRGWKVDVAVGSVMGRWADIVGADIATHVEPVTFADGVLTVRADSTAWATQMTLLSSSVLARVEEEIGAGSVSRLTVLGPSAPSWNRGPRRSPDSRGPRDTYG